METKVLLSATKKALCDTPLLSEEIKNNVLLSMARHIVEDTDEILAANEKDVEKSRGIISNVMIDRLTLTKERIEAMAEGIKTVAALPDPVGKVLGEYNHPNGLLIKKVSVPLGVVAIIYESRPNVTSDAAALAFKSGNACVLRGGKEAYNSACAIVNSMKKALGEYKIPSDFINLVSDTTRQSAMEIMTANEYVDMLIPRGGHGLISSCVKNATVPCIQTGTGICHIYVDESADVEMAVKIVENAKTSRPSVCNACEVCLVHNKAAKEFLPALAEKIGSVVEFRVDKCAAEYISGVPAVESDFDTEFLDYKLAVKVVDGLEEAVSHISAHSTHHSDVIVTENAENAERFLNSVDSSAVYWNASSRFTDGGEFGLGCEMGISTQKLHARGPMGLFELTTYKYKIYGDGQIR